MFVYIIVNNGNLKFYIGKTKNADLHAYLRRKIWSAQTGRYKGRSHLFHAMQKYHSTVWSIYPLFEVGNHAEICEQEILLIKALAAQNPEIGYNICAGGEGHRASPNSETRKKLSVAIKLSWSDPEIRRTHQVRLRGRKQPLDAVAKMKVTRKARYEQSGYPGLDSFKDMAGTVINGVDVLSRMANDKADSAFWMCRCYCGKTFKAKGACLRSGHTKSCGCLKIKQDQANLRSFESNEKRRASMLRYWATRRPVLPDLQRHEVQPLP